MALFSRKLGVDLGTVNVVIATGREIILQEPAMVALTVEDERIVAIGQEARDMFGRHPEHIEVIRPLKNGVIADYEVTEAMLRHFFSKIGARGRLFGSPQVVVSVPYGVTSVEQRAVREATLNAGAREAILLHEPLAAAIGAGLTVRSPSGNMILSLGGGTSEAAVLALNGIVVAASARVGGLTLDEAIITNMRRRYGLAIGQPTAESIKIQIGSAMPLEEELTMEVQGRDNTTGLPKTVEISTSEVVEFIEEPLKEMANAARSALEKTPPELASDIIDRGITITGGGALLRMIDAYIRKETGVPAYRAEDPLVSVAIGAARALDDQSLMRRMV